MTSFMRIKMPEPDPEEENLSFVERIKKHYADKKRHGMNANRASRLARCMMAFQAPTQLYITVTYIIPALFADYDDWTLYYLKAFVWFLCIEGLMNYFCTILFDSSYTKTADRPTLNGLHDRWNNPPDQFIPYDASRRQQNGHAINMANTECDNGGISWQYCESSEMYIPPRSHYCKVCKKCILKRDHHCYMVGTCIGFYNQRYFVMLAFYTVWVGFLGGYWTYSYLKQVYWPEAISWTDFVLPCTIIRTLLGMVPIHICIMVYHIYVEFLFGFVGFVYFTSQMTMIAQGKTLYEVANELPVKNNNSINTNFVSVFGNFWLLNFLFPMVLVLRQPDDGTVWEGVKMDHNAKSEKNVTD